MAMRDDIEKVLLTESQLSERVAQLGRQISEDYQGKDLVMVSLLKGAVVFVTDLMRAIDIHTQIDFMSVSSYGGTTSTGEVKILKDLDIKLENCDLLVVEDILDTGRTLSYISEILKARSPKSFKICTLLDKPSHREANVNADYVGFVIPDEFVVGYGLDYNEKYRNLPYIGVLKSSVYTAEDAEIMKK